MNAVSTTKDNSSIEIFGSFLLNENEFAISVTYVREVVNPPAKYTEVPLAPPYLKGLFNLRGMIIPVVDLRILLKMKNTKQAEDEKIAIIDFNGCSIGLIFDKTHEIFKSRKDERSNYADTTETSVISGAFKKNNGKRIIQIVNIEGLFNLQNIPKQSAKEGSVKSKLTRKRSTKKQCVSFKVASAKYALGINDIQEIIRIKEINEMLNGQDGCVGTIDIRGITVPIINFAELLGYVSPEPMTNQNPDSYCILVMKLEEELFGLLVDDIDSIISYLPKNLLPFPAINTEKAEIFLGCISQENRQDILLLNQKKILSHTQIFNITHGHSQLFNAQQNSEVILSQKRKNIERRTYITFSIEETFAIEIEKINEIIELPTAYMHPPGLPKHFYGVFNHRGNLVILVDTREMYGKKKLENKTDEKILVFNLNKIYFGLIVDSINAIISHSISDIMRLPDILHNKKSASLTEDSSQAIEIDEDSGIRRTILILDINSIANRVCKSLSSEQMSNLKENAEHI